MQSLQPVEVSLSVALDQCVLSSERRVTDYGIKAGFFSVEHFRKLNLPMKGPHRKLTGAELLNCLVWRRSHVALQELCKPSDELVALFAAGAIFVGSEKGGDYAIACRAHQL